MGSEHIQGRTCCACGSPAIAVLEDARTYTYRADDEERTWVYRLLQCECCRMGIVDPLPDPAVLASFYTKEYASYGPQSVDSESFGLLKLRIARLRTWGILGGNRLMTAPARALGWLVEAITGRAIPCTMGVPLQLPENAAIMDVGYGAGEWLESMHRFGYRNLFGFDIDANREHVERLQKLDVHLSAGNFLDCRYPDAGFDCIRLNHVIEHLTDPVSVLMKIRSMLKPDGVFVLSHPCFNSWMTKADFERAPTMQLPIHLYHHTPQSTVSLLEKTGFAPKEVKTYSVGYMLTGLLDRLAQEKGYPCIAGVFGPILTPLYALFCALTGKGDIITAYATLRE